MFWHVPFNAWHQGAMFLGAGVQNIGRDCIVPLISTNPTGNSPVPDDVSNYVVKRIVGQWMLQGAQAVAENHVIHNRIYPVTSDNVSISLRTLDDDDDAESDFLWHQVSPWPQEYSGDLWGSWQAGSPTLPHGPFSEGRHGNVDVKVNRKIRDGQDLIWHTQISGVNPPVNDEFDLFLWLRCLLVNNG